MKDMHSHILLVSAIGAAVFSADVESGSIDLQGYNSAEIALAIGAGGIAFSGANKIEFVLSHSDDGVNFIPVATNDVLGAGAIANGIVKALVAAQAAPGVYRFGYKGGKRYLKLVADFSGTHGTGTPIAAIVIKGAGFNRPEADQA